jgi:hypothetical protein
MATYKPATRTDFNLTNDFSGSDLDISWAHLQVKALVSSSGNTTIEIGGTQFDTSAVAGLRDAVQKMYETNITAEIAAESDGPAYDLPEFISCPSYLRVWKLNDCIPHDSISTNSNKTPTTGLDSVTGERTAIISNDFYWARSGKTDNTLTLSNNTGTVSIDDGGSVDPGDALVDNNGPYSLSFTFATGDQWGNSYLFTKGSMKVWLEGTRIQISRDGTTKKLFYDYPVGKTKDDFKNNGFHQFTLQRYKVLVGTTAVAKTKIFLDTEECVQTNDIDLGAIFLNADLGSPIVFKNRPILSVKDVYITNEVVNFPAGAEAYAFASRLDQGNSYNRITGANELAGDFGGYVDMQSMPATQGQENAWMTISTSKTNVNGVPQKVSRNLTVGGSSARSFLVNDNDLTRNFTVCAWVKGHHDGNSGKVNTDKFEPFVFRSASGDIFKLNCLSSGNLYVTWPTGSATGFSATPSWKDNYNHILVNRNGGLLDIYVNGEHKKVLGIGNKLDSMASADLIPGGISGNAKLHLMSSFKLFNYAVLPPHIPGQTSHLTAPIVNNLKENNI